MKPFTLNDAIQKKCKDSQFKESYERELMINAIASKIVALRKKENLTQKELTDRAGTTQTVISRLESGKDKRVPSLPLLDKIAKSSNSTLSIDFIHQSAVASKGRNKKNIPSEDFCHKK